MKGRSRIRAGGWMGLVIAGMLMLALGSMHFHDIHQSLQVTASHPCFLCQVSPNVEVEPGFESTGADLPAVPVPLTVTFLAPCDPDLSTHSARSPPP